MFCSPRKASGRLSACLDPQSILRSRRVYNTVVNEIMHVKVPSEAGRLLDDPRPVGLAGVPPSNGGSRLHSCGRGYGPRGLGRGGGLGCRLLLGNYRRSAEVTLQEQPGEQGQVSPLTPGCQ